jgi:transcriptional regulator with XRE-family HTH domain
MGWHPERLREARLRSGLSQTQLARAVETSERNIARWERVDRLTNPSGKYLIAIAEATGQPLGYFLNDDGAAEDEEDEDSAVRELLSSVRKIIRAENKRVRKSEEKAQA